MPDGGGAGRRGNINRWADLVELDDKEDVDISDPSREAWASKAPWEAPIEHWSSHFSEELCTAWHILKEYCESQGLPLLENASYPDFVDFAFKYSSKHLN